MTMVTVNFRFITMAHRSYSPGRRDLVKQRESKTEFGQWRGLLIDSRYRYNKAQFHPTAGCRSKLGCWP